MTRYKVIITDYEYDNVNVEKSILSESGIDFLEMQLYGKEETEIIDALKDADAIITQFTNISKNIIDHLKHCKLIIKHGAGFNNINCQAATEKGIYVSNVPDYGVDEVSNHAIALIMSLARKIPTMTKTIKDGDWGYKSSVPIKRFEGSTLGFVGFGRIPKLIAQKMKNFNLNMLAYNPSMAPETAEAYGVTLVNLNTLCEQSDYISVHTPLTDKTRHLFGANEFKRMKKTAYIINTARGPVISNEDLIEALKNGEIAGAGLDVFEEEPLDKDNELVYLDNVILTPHSAWYSEEAKTTLERKTAEEVINVLNGNIPFNLVNKDVLIKQQ
jgi:D-3-phosphoglycerate dehydrogenase